MATGQGHVKVEDVTKIYDPEGANVLAVEDCSFEIKPGEFLAIVGPSGCGKTTLLNMIAGFDHVEPKGKIYVDGELLAAPDKKLQPGPDRVVVFQQGALFPWKTVLENVIFGPRNTGKYQGSELKEKAEELLAFAGMKEFMNDFPSRMSSGMQRRVEIIRALINEPTILLLDEPFRALDAITKAVMHRFLLDTFDYTHKTIMFITHDLEESIYLSDRVAVMTTRPGKFKTWIDVKIPRPRETRVKASPEFIRLKEEVIEAVHEEAIKAFQRGEREMA
ncbi:MAG: ABC transporter ATP-binding protein [Nitrospirota bacterium]